VLTNEPMRAPTTLRKNKIAQALVALRHKKLSPERRAEIASIASKARWEKWRRDRQPAEIQDDANV